MFIGHYAVALAAKKAAPHTSLGTLILSAQFLDLLWPILLLAGVEHVRIAPGITPFTPLEFYDYPITHSLLMACVWGGVAAAIYFVRKRDRIASIVLALCVVSHWVLDFVSHRPDMPLVPGLHKYVGLGLWYSPAATIAVELVLFAIGCALYFSTTRAKDRTGSISVAAFLGFLLLTYLMNARGDAPPSVPALAWVSLSLWLLAPWGHWIDRHRETKSPIARTASA